MKESAGLLLFRDANGQREVLLAHPGGPFWAKKDVGAWTIPKGEVGPAEDPLAAALREFEEETGVRPKGDAIALPPRRQPSPVPQQRPRRGISGVARNLLILIALLLLAAAVAAAVVVATGDNGGGINVEQAVKDDVHDQIDTLRNLIEDHTRSN